MRSENDVRKRAKRFGDGRLALVDVKARAGDLPGLECLGKRRLVDDRPPGGVHEDRVGAHSLELGGPDQVMRLRRERTVEADHVRTRDELPECDALVWTFAAVVDDVQAETSSETGNSAPDAPQSDDAERASRQAAAQHEGGRPLPGSARTDEAIALGNAPRDVEDQCESQLGCRLGENIRGVRDDDAPARGRLEIDVVVADSVVGNHVQLGPGSIQQLVVDAVGEHRDQAPATGDSGKELRSRGGAVGRVHPELEEGVELLVNPLGDTAREENRGLHEILLAVGNAGGHHAQVRELTPELRALYDLSQAAAQGRAGVSELLDRICATVTQTFGFTRVTILRLDEASGLLTPMVARGIDLDDLPQAIRLSDQPLFARAVETGEAVFVEDVSRDEAVTTELVDDSNVRSALALPLVSEGRSLGVLGADRKGEPFELEPGTRDVLTTIGAVAGVYLERALEASELRRLNEVARNFVALASHELRTPAAVVHGIAATLHLRSGQLTEDQRSELERTLHEQTDRLRRLVDQLLDLSRLEAHALDVRPQRFRVRRRVEELLLMAAAERLGEVELDLDPALEAVADPDAFDRVVTNLITNAFRYGKPPIRVQARGDDGTFVLAVEDNGEGVAPEFVPRLFERFARDDEAAKAPMGSGLGLAIAQSYARAHGGQIVYTAGATRGARFELVLPSGVREL
jgi:signal transduction histidine kinase